MELIKRWVSASIAGTLSMLVGGVITVVGLWYVVVPILIDIFTPPSPGPTPAGGHSVWAFGLLIIVVGAVFLVIGLQLIYYRE